MSVADVIVNEIYVDEVVSKYVGVLWLVFCGGEGNELSVEFCT